MDWQTISIVTGIIVILSAAQVKAYDWILRRHLDLFEARFHSIDARVEKLETGVAEIRRDYIRREDWMRQTASIEVKLDILSARIETLSIDRRRGGGDVS